jgi:hypothetical protein
MIWLIAIGIGQLIVLGYIALCIGYLYRDKAAYTNLILGQLSNILEKLSNIDEWYTRENARIRRSEEWA